MLRAALTTLSLLLATTAAQAVPLPTVTIVRESGGVHYIDNGGGCVTGTAVLTPVDGKACGGYAAYRIMNTSPYQ